MRHGLAAFPPQHVGKAPLAAPNNRKKRSGREKMRQPNQAGPKKRDPGQNHQAVSAEPMHDGILRWTSFSANGKNSPRRKRLLFSQGNLFSRSEGFGASFHLSGSSRTNQQARSERSIIKEQPAERGVPE